MRPLALARQGGGSHTPFTGAALHLLLADGSHRVVALSGTSGGAVCALLAWYGLLTGGAAEGGRLLERFWEANAATTLRLRSTSASTSPASWTAGPHSSAGSSMRGGSRPRISL